MENARKMDTADVSVVNTDAENAKVLYCTLRDYTKISTHNAKFLERAAIAGRLGAIIEYSRFGRQRYRYLFPIKDPRLQERLVNIKKQEYEKKTAKLLKWRAEVIEKLIAKLNRGICRVNQRMMKEYDRISSETALCKIVLDPITLIPKVRLDVVMREINKI